MDRADRRPLCPGQLVPRPAPRSNIWTINRAVICFNNFPLLPQPGNNGRLSGSLAVCTMASQPAFLFRVCLTRAGYIRVFISVALTAPDV